MDINQIGLAQMDENVFQIRIKNSELADAGFYRFDKKPTKIQILETLLRVAKKEKPYDNSINNCRHG